MKKTGIAVILLIALSFPVISSPYLLSVGIMVLIFMGLATSLNLIVGYVGQISFAHAAFWGIGAYTSAIITTNFETSYWSGFLGAILISGIIGLLLGYTCLRLQGQYLAIATIGFQQIVMIVLLQWSSLTNGAGGISGIPRPEFLGERLSNQGMYYLGLFLLALIVLLTIGMLRSKIGLQMIAVREDEVSARASGINTKNIKLIAFTLSSAMAGAMGSFYAHYISAIDPNAFNIMVSATILVMLLGGGIGTIAGPILGALLLQTLPEMLRSIDGFRMVVFGLILILIILYMPDGVVGLYKKISKSFVKRFKVKNDDGSEKIAS